MDFASIDSSSFQVYAPLKKSVIAILNVEVKKSRVVS